MKALINKSKTERHLDVSQCAMDTTSSTSQAFAGRSSSNLSCVEASDLVSKPPRSLTIWLNSNEAAQFLKVTTQMLWNLTSNGKVPYYKLGRSNRYRLDELEALLLKNKRGLHD